MKQDIHPDYTTATVHCACGNRFSTRSTLEDIHIEICSVCHPFFTGKQKLVDTAGRVERFREKYGKAGEGRKAGGAKAAAKPEPEPQPEAEVEASADEATGESA